jgi:hypothetical protein
VTGPQLQGIFGLMSTYMSFSTISTNATMPPARGPSARGVEQAPLAAPSLHGSVAPAAPGAVVDIQRLTAGQWRTVATSRLGLGNSYRTRLAASGHYRVAYGGMVGPAVTVR